MNSLGVEKIQILERIGLHCRGLDRLDVGLLKDCYWPEAQVDYGAFNGAAHDFADMVVPALKAQYQLTRHSICNSLVNLDGHQARVESHVNARHLLLSGEEEMTFFGRYLDALEKRDGHWRLLYRQVVMDWSRREQVVDERDSEAFKDMAKGSHSDDPSYAFMGYKPA